MSLDRWVALSSSTTLRAACSSLQLALQSTIHSHSCPSVHYTSKSRGNHSTRGLHSTASPHRQTQPKVVLRDGVPPQWPYQGTKRDNAEEFSQKMRDYRSQVAVLRNEWRPLVERHNKEVRFALLLLG